MPFNDTTPLLEKLRGGEWRVAQPGGLVYTTNDGRVIIVPEGFETNLASVPAIFWPILPRDGDYAPAAIVHDWLYGCHELDGRPCTRAEADGVMLEAMEALGVGWLRRWTLYAAVRVGAWWAWWRARRPYPVGNNQKA